MPETLTARFSDAIYTNEEGTEINMQLEHPRHGWIPITINESEYPELWAEVVATNPAPFIV